MPVRLALGWTLALASLAVGIYAAVRQERASLWSWGICLFLLVAAMAALRRPGNWRRRR
jgi:quinol-cytochrome oxidoreductase complex cytochrome b subunit